MTIIACESEAKQHNYKMTDVSYSSEGTTLAGALWLPEGDGPFPAMVIAHGSGRSSRMGARYMAEHFAKMGFAILSYDKRGVGDSGGTYVGRLNASKGNLTLLAKDVAAGVEFLKERNDIDVNQIGLYGWSQAGWIIPIVATMKPEVKFTLLISGPTVTVGEENYYSSLTGDGSKESDLTQTEMSQKLKEKGPFGFDPLPYLKKMNMPGLWLLGSADKSIPIPETVIILDRMIKVEQRDFTYQVFEGADHSLRINRQTVPDYWKTQDDFLLKKVKIKFAR